MPVTSAQLQAQVKPRTVKQRLVPVDVQANIKSVIQRAFTQLESKPYTIHLADAAPAPEAAEHFRLAREAALHFGELNAKGAPSYFLRSRAQSAHHEIAAQKSELTIAALVIPFNTYAPPIVAYQALRDEPATAVPLYAGKNPGEGYRSDGRTFTLPACDV